MFSSRIGTGRSVAGKEIVIIPSSQMSGGNVKIGGKISSGASYQMPRSPTNVQYMSEHEVITPPTRITVASGGKIMTLTPGPVKTSTGAIKRPLEYDFSMNIRKFPRSTDKSKGLRHFSTKVCDKVREKGVTNYNEVADELVQEYFESMPNPPSSQEKQIYDQKNIRRRVYDALNVLMAMNIISKEKKEIRWIGLPTSSVQECRKLEDEKSRRMDRICQKTETLRDMVIQLIAFKSLVERNKVLEKNMGKPLPNTVIQLPYVIVNTDRKTEIDCSISADKTEYVFKFNQPFQIHDDNEILKRLGFACGLDVGQVRPDEIKTLKNYLPVALRDYIEQIASGKFMTKYMPLTSTSRPGGHARSVDKYANRIDAADLEVAMTLSSSAGAASRQHQGPQLQYANVPYSQQQHQQRMYFGSGPNEAVNLDAQVEADDHEAIVADSDQDDSDRSDFSDMESLESNSNEGY